MRLRDPGLAAPRGGAPVDPADAVSRDERAEVGELDPLAPRARNLVTGEDLRLHRPEQPLQRVATRVDLEWPPPFERPLVDEQPERILRPQDEVADEVAAPVIAAELVLERPPLAVAEPQQLRVRRLRHEPGREVQQELEVTYRALGVQVELGRNGLALKLPLGHQLEDRVDVRLLGEREPREEHE